MALKMPMIHKKVHRVYDYLHRSLRDSKNWDEYQRWNDFFNYFSGGQSTIFYNMSNEIPVSYHNPSLYDLANICLYINKDILDIVRILDVGKSGDCLEWKGNFTADGDAVISKFIRIDKEGRVFYDVVDRKNVFRETLEYREIKRRTIVRKFNSGKINGEERARLEALLSSRYKRSIVFSKIFLHKSLRTKKYRKILVCNLLCSILYAKMYDSIDYYKPQEDVIHECKLGKKCVNPFHKSSSFIHKEMIPINN